MEDCSTRKCQEFNSLLTEKDPTFILLCCSVQGRPSSPPSLASLPLLPSHTFVLLSHSAPSQDTIPRRSACPPIKRSLFTNTCRTLLLFMKDVNASLEINGRCNMAFPAHGREAFFKKNSHGCLYCLSFKNVVMLRALSLIHCFLSIMLFTLTQSSSNQDFA